MTLIVVGLNHKSTPESVLEKLTFSSDQVSKVLVEVSSSAVVAESVVVSTCNRTEVYVQAERFHDAFRDIREALATIAGLASESFVDHLYVQYDDEAVRHLFDVSAGLDSAVLGEHEILGQIRRAWDQARVEDQTGALLNLLFQRAIEAGKRVRSETAIGEATASLPKAAVSLVDDRVADLADQNVLLIGAGELGSGVAAALCRSGVRQLSVANRTRGTAEKVAAELGASVVDFTNLAEGLQHADVVISATGAEHRVLGYEEIVEATASEGGTARQILLVDLAMPRDIAPEVDELTNVESLLLKDLQDVANRGIAQRQTELGPARQILDEELERHRVAKSTRTVAPVIGSLHAEVEAIRQSELERLLPATQEMTPEQLEAVEKLTKSVLAKVLHSPTTKLKGAAGTTKGELLSDAVRILFELS